MLPRNVRNPTVGEVLLAGVETPRWFAITQLTASPRRRSSSAPSDAGFCPDLLIRDGLEAS